VMFMNMRWVLWRKKGTFPPSLVDERYRVLTSFYELAGRSCSIRDLVAVAPWKRWLSMKRGVLPGGVVLPASRPTLKVDRPTSRAVSSPSTSPQRASVQTCTRHALYRDLQRLRGQSRELLAFWRIRFLLEAFNIKSYAVYSKQVQASSVVQSAPVVKRSTPNIHRQARHRIQAVFVQLRDAGSWHPGVAYLEGMWLWWSLQDAKEARLRSQRAHRARMLLHQALHWNPRWIQPRVVLLRLCWQQGWKIRAQQQMRTLHRLGAVGQEALLKAKLVERGIRVP
ncbi:MAG: hypothetical protein AAGJ35_03100, partial [Myxococcota bacterium]